MIYVKALSVRNITDMVYATRLDGRSFMINSIFINPNEGDWLVWLASEGPIFTVLSNEQMLNQYTLYKDLPTQFKVICDSHPEYDDWVKTQNIINKKALAKREPGP